MNKIVRTKTVEEVKIEGGRIFVWRPRVKGQRCQCFEDYDPNRVCESCYGIGINGGYHEGTTVAFIDAEYEEVTKCTTTIGNTTSTQITLEDEIVTLTFDTPFHYHIYPGCIFELDLRYWKVMGVEEKEADEDDDGFPLPDRWGVVCRKLEQFEPAVRFMETRQDLADSIMSLEEVEGPAFINPRIFQGGKLLALCPKCNASMTVAGPKSMDEEIKHELVCDECGHTWEFPDGDG